MNDPVLHVMAWVVLFIDLGILFASLIVAYLIIRYRRGIALWYAEIKAKQQ